MGAKHNILAGEYLASQKELEVGDHLAFFLVMPEEKGGDDWYVGKVGRLCKPYWADVIFPDGNLWCAVKPSERGSRWHPVVVPVSPTF